MTISDRAGNRSQNLCLQRCLEKERKEEREEPLIVTVYELLLSRTQPRLAVYRKDVILGDIANCKNTERLATTGSCARYQFGGYPAGVPFIPHSTITFGLASQTPCRENELPYQVFNLGSWSEDERI